MDYLLNKGEIKWKEYLWTVLNLIINGLPSKLKKASTYSEEQVLVLNLIINGLPSKHGWFRFP